MEIQNREFRMRWSQEVFPAKIEVMTPHTGSKVDFPDSSIVNFSRQGMFLQTHDHLRIQVGSQFDFALNSVNDAQDIRGKAEVKWVRPVAINSRLPQGFGIHLIDFKDHSGNTYQNIFESCLFNLTVDEVYLRHIPTINLQTDLSTAMAIFQAFSVQTLVVVDRELVPIGVLFQKDLFQVIGFYSNDPSDSKTIMGLLKPISQFLEPSLRVREAFHALKTGVRFDIPVIDKSRYLGILPIDLVLNYWSAYSDASYQRILKNYETSLFEIAHDLRQPIGYIMTVQYLLKSGDLSLDEYKASNYQDAIDRSCHNMLSMIEEILDLPRLRLGHIQVVNKPENIYLILDSIVAKNQQLATKKMIEIKLEIIGDPKDFQSILIDSRRFEQVLNNLLSNAVKYSKDSSPILVAVSVEGETSENHTLIIKVIDSGVGIASEHLPHLFKEGSVPFDSHLHGGESTGLGLSIVKKIVTAMGGSIEVQSKLGHGSTFTLTLPLTASNASESSIS